MLGLSVLWTTTPHTAAAPLRMRMLVTATFPVSAVAHPLRRLLLKVATMQTRKPILLIAESRHSPALNIHGCTFIRDTL